jgi:hypothetical protein
MRLTRNEHRGKLRAHIGDISDWLMNADVSGFATPAMLASGYTTSKKGQSEQLDRIF